MKNLKTRIILIVALFAGIALQAQTIAPSLADATANGDGSYTNWFGTFTPEGGELGNEGWVSHEEHGRLYVVGVGDGLWAYDPNVAALGDDFHGWIYSSEALFPYFYVEPNTYLAYVAGIPGPAATPRVFLNASTLDQLLLPKATTQTIVGVAAASEPFSSLVTAVQTAGLVETLSGEGPFTVFAPNNDAFGKLDPDTLNDLLTNEESLPALTDILTYHVVPGRITSDMLGLDVINLLKGATAGGYVEAVNGSDLRFDLTPFGVMINGSSMVTMPDIETSNGVIHVIDTVLLPPSDIVDTAVNAGFDTLVAAVQAAGLEGALRGEGPFTVFAPTEEAFAALGQETLNSLLGDPETLANILTYHVVGAEVYSANVAPGEVGMFNGDNATISVGEDGSLMIDGATIVTTDIVTANGVIHIIDSVILPPAE